MVNAAREGQSEEKLWWRLVVILTCQSAVTLGYWDERQTEPSSSLFLSQPQDNGSSTASSGKATDWRNRERAVLTYFFCF